ncbi:MAG: hypothetical protein F2793_04290 [Actinobacteria bacterium]|uniref:Unannotated protein n=1 Tax=freshwater metagenome TaxID=449393 RepID=A0A6J7DZ93_9ZZZZ|nr:hypothetical protein [Actinomycetota bacterium]
MTFVRRTTSVLAAGAAIGVVAGIALGVMWWRLAPRVSVVVRPDSVFPETYQPDGYLGADVSYAALACIAGIAVTIGLVTMRREHLLSSLWAAFVAGTIGSILMWVVGTRLGSVDISGLSATIEDKVVVEAPLQLTMPALVLMWPLMAALVITVLAFADWWSDFRSRRSEQLLPGSHRSP